MQEISRCPSCDSAQFRKACGVAPAFETRVAEKTFEQPAYDVRECLACGLYFKSRIWSEHEEAEYYRLQDYRKWESASLFPTDRAVLDIAGNLPEGSSILDFGCSNGRLLDSIGSRLLRFGFEINERAADAARSKGIGLMSNADLESDSIGRFQAIVLSDVIEHLRNPMFVLRQLDRYLAPGGLLIVSTGDVDAPACQRDVGGFWYLRNVEHVVMLGRRYCEHIAKELGYRIVEWRVTSHYDVGLRERAVQHLRDKAYWMFRDKSPLASIMGLIPWLRRAQRWPTPPALECTADHVVIAFKKQG